MSATSKISANQVAYKKKVGSLDGDIVYEVGLKGGLHLIVKAGDNAPLGAGPHRAVARHIAKKKNPDIKWTELSKSDHLEPYLFEAILSRYEALTEDLGRVARAPEEE